MLTLYTNEIFQKLPLDHSVGLIPQHLHPLFSPGSRVVNHFSSRIGFHSPSSSSDKDLYQHLQNLNHAFRTSQICSNSIAVITDGGVKKSHITTVVAHIWSDNSVVKQFQAQSINVTSIEAELMVITGLIPTVTPLENFLWKCSMGYKL